MQAILNKKYDIITLYDSEGGTIALINNKDWDNITDEGLEPASKNMKLKVRDFLNHNKIRIVKDEYLEEKIANEICHN